MWIRRIIACLAFFAAGDLAAADGDRISAAPQLAQALSAAAPGSASEIQNIQRLLKLLADRYPRKYGAVDPGRVDGTVGDSTRDAIRNFRKISGNAPGRQTNEQLVADILATLAQMSATQGADAAPEKPDVPRTENAANAAPAEAEKKADEEPARNDSGTDADSNAPAQASTALAAAAVAPPVPRAKVTPPAPPPAAVKVQAAADRRVYFVQAASLRSLDAAKREWQRIFDENRAALKGEQVYFERAAIADRGVFYRILIGPMAESEAAKTLCAFLKQNDQTCVVTVRNLADLAKPENGEQAPSPSGQKPADDKRATAVPVPKAKEANETAQTPTVAPTTPNDATAASPASAGKTAQRPDDTDSDTKTNAERTPAAPAANSSGTPASAIAALPVAEAAKPGTESPKTDTPATNPQEAETKAAEAAPLPGAAGPSAQSPAPSTPTTPVAPAAVTPSVATAPAANSATAPAATPAPRTDFGDFHAKVAAESPKAAAPAPMTTEAAVAVLVRSLGGKMNVAGIAAAVIAGAGLLLFLWRRQSRQSVLAQIFQSGLPAFARPATDTAETPDTLTALETDFSSEPLRQSRTARDEFLRDILGDQADMEGVPPKEDSAIRINSSLKSLLISDPAQYKSIFLNWIFLSKVGAALNQQEITMEQLNGNFAREFNILQNYFKIHLLELDDRHRIRKELPGLFYCLQLAQQRNRQSSNQRFTAA